MREKTKRLISLTAAISMLSPLCIVPETALAEEMHSCDFTQLVQNGAETAYGTNDSVIQLDEYTTAHLTYEGTYVSADGKVYLKSDTVCNGNGRYAKGSYIAFTAPSDGTITVTGADLGWFEGDVYKGYNSSITIDAVGGTTYNFGYRKASTYIDSLTFSPSESGGETEMPTEDPGVGDTVPVYESPLSSWDFNAYAPAAGGINVPYISGNAEYDSENGAVKFPSGTTASGYLTIDFDKPVRNNVEISFDYAGHTKALGNQFINYRIVNSEGEEIVSFSGHPYSSDAVYGSNMLTVCGTAAASGDAVRNLVSGVGTPITIKTAIDYNARKVTVTAGDSVLTGEISESAAKDIAKIEISGTRSKTEASRYMSIDNLCVSEFDSTEPSAPAGDIANDYEEKTFGRFVSRVNAPAESGLPLVVYLCGESRFGTDNYSQLYNAQAFFDRLMGKAVLAAPQTGNKWDADALADYIAEVKAAYNTSDVIVAGQSEGAAAAYALAANGAADKIIPIAGTADISGSVNAAVWAFGGFLDTKVAVADIRKPVNALQSAGASVRYTEYPEDGHNIAGKAAAEPGLTEWILNDTDDKKIVDLVLFAGQSNMAGRGTAAEAVVCPAGMGYELHTVGNAKLADGEVPYVLSTVTEPFGKNENNDIIHDAGSNGIDRRSGDMVPAFMKAYYEKTGVPIVGVQASRGGQETRWFVTADVKSEMTRRYNDAAAYLEKAGYTVRKKFMVWCQGEGDADNNRSQSVYKGNTLDIFNNMKSAGVTDMFIIKTGHYNINYGLSDGAEPSAEALEKDARYKNVNTWQQELADENDNVYTVADLYTDSSLAQMRDQYHYYQPVYNEIGTTAGAAAAEVYGDEPVSTEKPSEKKDVFEIVSAAAEIDVTPLVNYGSDTYRIYKADRSYTDAKAENGKVSNTTGGEVTVVPIYRFNYTTGAMAGYTDATGAYSADTGYGLLSGINYNTNENGSLPVSGRPLHIDLPYGSYDINILRKGGARADVYNDDIQIINNTTSSGSQNRPAGSALMYAPQVLITDGSADITIGNTSGAKERIAAVEIVRVPDQYKKHIVWIAGDSESANYYPIDADGDDLANDKIMMTGFGMQLGRFLSSDHYKIANWGQPSATVGTWYDECFSSVLYRMEAGDTLLVDFGINDAVSSSNATSVEVMKERMKEIFDAAKAKEVQPILVSPLWNSKYQHRTYFTYNADTDSNEMYAFAKECGVPCIDLNKGTMRYKDAAIAATGDSDWAVHNYHVGDNLHQTQHSAVLNAAIIAGGMKKMGYVTTDFAETYKDISAFDAADSTKRGEESCITREYSIAALEDYITIAGEEIKIEEPTIPPALTDGITVSGKTVSVVLTDADNAVLIYSKHDSDGRLTGIKVYDLTFINGRAEQEIPELAEGDELYVWDSLSGMKPLLDKAAVKSAPATVAPTETTTVTQSPSFVPTDEPSEMLYSEDFEGYAAGSTGGWTSPAGKMSIKSDSTSGIGKYQTVVSGKSGTCRSGYVELPDAIDKNFVFECDYKSSSNVNVSDLELLEAKSSVYANHGVYSNANFVFTMARPKGSDLYVINNKTDDSGLQADGYTDPVFTSKEISGNPRLHVKVVGDFDNQRVIVYITSLDGKTEYLHGMYDMNVGRDKKITSWKCLHLLSPTTGADTCIDNIKVRTAVTSDLAPVYHKVRLSLGTYSFEQYVLDGESVINIPDTSLYGASFEGWRIGTDEKLYTSGALAAAPITTDCEINGSISEDYIEALSTVEFRDFPAGNELAMGADENTYGDNIISLAITGEQGTSLVTSPDSRVEDYKIEWEFDGFRTLDGTPTGETGTKYCDSYGLIEITEKAQSSVNFRLKRTSANYYGRVKAAVTYNGKTIEVEKPLVLLGDKSGTALLPKPGYTADFNKYEDSMIGYRLSGGDVVTGGWVSSGSDATYMKILSDSTGKYLSLSRAASGNSSYVHNEIGELTKQTVFEQDVRFGLDGTIRYIGGSTTTPTSTAFSFSKSGANLTFNGNTIYTGASSSEWYHIVITADPTSRLTYAKVYDMSGRQLGASGTVSFSAYTSGAYYEIVLDTRSNKASIDINNIRVYEPEPDTDSFKITMPETAAIPESGTVEIDLSAAAKTTDGDAVIGRVSWAVADELAEGVSIESTGNGTAKLVISSSAVSDSLPISASVGGKTVTAEIKLIGTKDNVAFVSAPAGIQLGTAAEYIYSAEVRNSNAETVSGRSITYSLANADGTAAAAAGVSIDSASGRLTVSADAKPQTIYVKAVSTDSTGNEISRLTKTVLYSLSFSFGTNAPAAGFTQVTADTAYSASKGFGIEGTAADTAAAVTGSGFTFKVRLEKGRVYNVKAKYEGTIRCERVNSDFAGFDRKKDTLGEDAYSVAVFGDNIMDITMPSAGKLASVEITPVTKKAAAKPDWWTIGDSTVQQNGSWGYTIAAEKTTDLSKYPELAAVINGFHNSGKAGEQHKNFYVNGRLNAILTQMNPGDTVSISGMGTNDSSSSKEQFKAYDKMYMDAILDMGGRVILGSYTPTGNYGATQGKVYDADTMTFKGMRTNAYDLAIRELYEESKNIHGVLGFVDIGKMADEKMTANVQAVYAAAITGGSSEQEARAAADARAAELMAWWKDYNHYYIDFSNYILPDITKAVAELIGSAE